MPFSYKIFNENGDLSTTAEVVLVSASVETGRPQAMPNEILKVLKPYFL
jgi:acyl-CoA thioesterase FadM